MNLLHADGSYSHSLEPSPADETFADLLGLYNQGLGPEETASGREGGGRAGGREGGREGGRAG